MGWVEEETNLGKYVPAGWSRLFVSVRLRRYISTNFTDVVSVTFAKVPQFLPFLFLGLGPSKEQRYWTLCKRNDI
jgi:hypothetical protein